MRKVIALSFSDLHVHNWKQHNPDKTRLQLHIDALLGVWAKAVALDVPILFEGDLIQKGTEVSMVVLTYLMAAFQSMEHTLDGHITKAHIYAIPGNHDQDSPNRLGKNDAYDIIKVLAMVFPRVITDISYNRRDTGFKVAKNVMAWGVPYFRFNDGVTETIENIKAKIEEYYKPHRHILMIHTVLPGSQDTNGFKLGEEGEGLKNLSKLFEGFELVLCGHVHKPYEFGGGIYNIGAPLEQRTSDMGAKLGTWEIRQSGEGDLDLKFIQAHTESRYKTYTGDEAPDEPGFWIKAHKADAVEDGEEGGEVIADISDIVPAYFKQIGLKNRIRQKKLITLLQSVKND